MQDFRKLRVWQVAHELALDVANRLTAHRCRNLPGLRAQAIRAAISISANIAEGCGKDGGPELHRFLEMALGSLMELEAELMLARDGHSRPADDYVFLERRTATLRRMLISLMVRVRAAGMV